MDKALIILFETAPEVSKYMENNGTDLDTALNDLGMDISDGVDTRLKIVPEDSLDKYGDEDNDYVIVRGTDTLDFWGYDVNEVCDELDIDMRDLENLGVDLSNQL